MKLVQKLALDPTTNSSNDEIVTVSISQFVQDVAGNDLGSDYIYSFEVTSAPSPDPSGITLNASVTPSSSVPAFSHIIVSGTAQYNTGSPVTTATIQIDTGDHVYTAPLTNGTYSQDCVAPSGSRNICYKYIW